MGHSQLDGQEFPADASLNVTSSANLTIVGTNTVTLNSVTVSSSLENINITAGTLDAANLTTSLGDPNATVTVSTNATLELDSLTSILSKVTVLDAGATLKGAGTNIFAGTVNLAGNATVSVGTGALLTLSSLVSGPGNLSKNGSGSLILTASDSYSGTTLINGGTIQLTGSGSIASSTNIDVTAGATLDVSQLSPPTLAMSVGQTLDGSGTVIGSVTGAGGSFLAPGGYLTNTGTLTISNVLTLNAGDTTTMNLDNASGSNDMVAGMTSVSYGGTLTVSPVGGGVYTAGTSYQLFSAGSYGGSFSPINLPANVVWNTSNLGSNGTIQVVSVQAPTFSSANMSTNKTFSVNFTGPAGESWRLWSTTNVALKPVTNAWTLVTNGIINSTGTVNINNLVTTNSNAQFYEVTAP